MPDPQVVIVNDYAAASGGASQVARQQAMGLARLGVDVVFFAAVPDAVGERELTDHGVKVAVTGHTDLKARGPVSGFLTGLWNRAAEQSLARLLGTPAGSAGRCLILHSWSKALSASVARAGWETSTPLLAVAHDYQLACPNGAYFDYQAGRDCDVVPLSAACLTRRCDKHSEFHKLWRFTRQVIQHRVGGLPQRLVGVIYVSNAAREVLEPLLPAALPGWVLPNPVQVPLPLPRVDVSSNRHFLFMGRMDADKGPLLLAHAALAAGVEVVFVGDGEQRAEVQRVLPSARMTGWLSGDELWRELARARAVVMPTRVRETFGLVAYEAAALGIPAVVPAGTAAAAFVRDGINGLTTVRDDVASLADALARLNATPGLAARLGAQAKKDFEAVALTPEAHSSRLLDIIRTVCKL